MAELRFEDSETLDDLRTYVARARVLDPDGAIRLQSQGVALAAYVDVLPGRGPAMTGAVLGLRVMALAEPVDVDATVSLASVSDRLARGRTSTFSVPPTTVRVGWAAMSPPQKGWEVVGDLTVEELRTVATQGIAEITEGAPEGSGAQLVAALRQRVWGRDSRTTPPISSGAAFAAYSLGFLTQESARVLAHGRWTRLSTATGHVLVR
ncbi:MAG TPA: hypothetical protein VF391_03715 [Dermatophilaceae bacterium]|jgi:hypothetical protein